MWGVYAPPFPIPRKLFILAPARGREQETVLKYILFLAIKTRQFAGIFRCKPAR